MSLDLFSDRIAYWVLQTAFGLVFAWCVTQDWRAKRRLGTQLFVKRGWETIRKLAGLYAATAVIILMIDNQATPIQGYRVFWLTIHTTMMVHLFFFSGCFRREMLRLHGTVLEVREHGRQ